MLKYRLLTAVILIPIVIAALFLLSPANFGLVVIAVCALGAWEWAQFAGWHSPAKRIGLAVVFAVALLAIQFSLLDMTALANSSFILYSLWAGLIWWIAAILLVVTYPASASWGQISHNSIAIWCINYRTFLQRYDGIKNDWLSSGYLCWSMVAAVCHVVGMGSGLRRLRIWTYDRA
ncbi:Phosphatidate cytidylyltransferase [Providencia alcalifaciens]|nr:Phosphatidate cytidylyltransferase [Providencia alcalifaciens]